MFPARLWPRVAAGCLLIFVLCTVYLADRFQLRHKLLSVHKNEFERDLDDMKDILITARNRSPTAVLKDEFVGSYPLFPPCTSDIPSGIPAWGPNPHLGPFHYTSRSKNPCWYQRNEERKVQFLCLPFAFLAGVSKSGTSDVYFRVSNHPDFVRTKKELHWFDRTRYHCNTTIFQYARMLQKLTDQVASDLQLLGKSQKIAMDASPSYFYDSYEWAQFSGNEGCSEPRVILPSHIYHMNPRVKIILIFRHPVQRLYSRFLFDCGRVESCRGFLTPEKFHEFVLDGLQKFLACFKRRSLRQCVYDKTLRDSVHELRIYENLYSVYLEDWLRIIPRDQMLFLRFDDYVRSMEVQLTRIFQFLEMEPPAGQNMEWLLSRKPQNKGKYKASAGPMLAKTRKILEDFYQPFIRRFAAMIGDDKFSWNDTVYL